MRLFSGSALYHCARCRRRFLVLGANRKPVEQRRATRTTVNGALLAYTGQESEKSELGPVIDIGPGGFSFQYVAARPLPNGSFTVHLAPTRDRLKVRNLPVIAVSDVPTGETAPFSNISVRRCGLKFEDSSFRQRMLVRYLVRRIAAV